MVKKTANAPKAPALGCFDYYLDTEITARFINWKQLLLGLVLMAAVVPIWLYFAHIGVRLLCAVPFCVGCFLAITSWRVHYVLFDSGDSYEHQLQQKKEQREDSVLAGWAIPITLVLALAYVIYATTVH
jgi:hypothetical protein